MSWRRKLTEGRKVNDQIMKGKNAVPFKFSIKAKEIFIHILLMKHSRTQKTVISAVL